MTRYGLGARERGSSREGEIMATDTPTPAHERDEHCESCERRTQHSIEIEIRVEGDPGSEDGAYSREPYRVANCRRCGTERSQRMNNA